jgi:cold shock CspA family protein
MEGKMLWFNAEKGFGVICMGADERLPVKESGFQPGEIPVGRCAGRKVVFDVLVERHDTQAVNVVFAADPSPARARRRPGGRTRGT